MLGQIVLISAGSNQNSVWGDPETTLSAAIRLLAPLALGDVRCSPFYATDAFPPGAGPDFVNAAAAFETQQSAADILAVLHRIEAAAGRSRAIRWGQRTLDLDLVAVGDNVIPDDQTHDHWRNLPLYAQTSIAPDQLILPHPRLQDRSFVLVPLADIAPDWQHPLLGLTVTQMRDLLAAEARASVRRIERDVLKG
ncbi:2-amino-4-hydroxy-6-hydroxymethyldihydropteridine diphosphokinase [Yoonia sp.]|uniref:2-amino-4-hydroxy-6- hydroxymethyldihydropteridine diphosphokinase n=1 Tax=Yoonia sp. TaxID=2212373 RepID=UPI003A4E295C